MRICSEHWDKLRQALKDRGIDHLGAKNSEQLLENTKDQLNGVETEYDPLISCNYMIWSNGLKAGGLYLMEQKEDGTEYCPICEAVEHTPLPITFADTPGYELRSKEEHERWWIDGPADAALEECRRQALVPGKQ